MRGAGEVVSGVIMGLLDSLTEIVVDVATIVATPVEIVADAADLVVRPVAEAVTEASDSIRELTP